jgi:raffinose/stachyose/melibiose transport system substrate-binding protein
MSRRIIGVALTACALGVAACGGSDTEPSSGEPATAGGSQKVSGTIKFLASSTLKPNFEPAVAAFEKANPGAKVDVQYVPFPEVGTTYRTQAAAGNPPDVLLSSVGSSNLNSVVPLVKAGQLLDLSDRPWVKDVMEVAKTGVTVEGKTYAWPLDAVPNGLWYPKAAYAEAGITPPQTFDELIAACKKVAAGGDKYLFGANLLTGSGTFSSIFVDNVDPDWAEKRQRKEVTFAESPEWQRALEAHVEAAKAGCLGPSPGTVETGDQVVRSVAGGKALSANTGWQNIPLAEKSGIKDIQTYLFPAEKAEDTPLVFATAFALSVTKQSKNKDLALAWVDYMAKPENAAAYSEVAGTVDPYAFARNEFPAYMDTEQVRQAVKNGKVAKTVALLFPNFEVQLALNAGLQKLFNGQGSVQETLQSMDAAWDKGSA